MFVWTWRTPQIWWMIIIFPTTMVISRFYQPFSDTPIWGFPNCWNHGRMTRNFFMTRFLGSSLCSMKAWKDKMVHGTALGIRWSTSRTGCGASLLLFAGWRNVAISSTFLGRNASRITIRPKIVLSYLPNSGEFQANLFTVSNPFPIFVIYQSLSVPGMPCDSQLLAAVPGGLTSSSMGKFSVLKMIRLHRSWIFFRSRIISHLYVIIDICKKGCFPHHPGPYICWDANVCIDDWVAGPLCRRGLAIGGERLTEGRGLFDIWHAVFELVCIWDQKHHKPWAEKPCFEATSLNCWAATAWSTQPEGGTLSFGDARRGSANQVQMWCLLPPSFFRGASSSEWGLAVEAWSVGRLVERFGEYCRSLCSTTWEFCL